MTNAFNLSQLANNVNTSGQLNAAAGLYNQTPVANGGTGVASVASGNILVGAGTAAMTALTGGTTGNVVTWSGTAWVSQASSGGAAPVFNVFTTPGTWTKPATLKSIKVTVVGGGVSGGSTGAPAQVLPGGGAGGGSIRVYPAPSIPGPLPYTVGGLGATSSFGVTSAPAPFTVISATGGSGATGGTGSAGQINIGGQSGGNGFPNTSGPGGSSILGFGGQGVSGNTPGLPATGYGAGGSGAIKTAPVPGPAPTTGGTGTAGIVIVEEFY